MIVIAKGNIFWDGPIQSISNQTIHTIIIQRLTFFPSQKHFKILLSFHCQRLTMFVFLLCHISQWQIWLEKRGPNEIGSDGKQMAVFNFFDGRFIIYPAPLNWQIHWIGCASLGLVLMDVPHIFFPTVYWVECLGSSALAIHLNLVTYLNYAWLWRKFHISPHPSAKLQK